MNKKIDYDTLWIIECVWFSYGLRCKSKKKKRLRSNEMQAWLAEPWSSFWFVIPAQGLQMFGPWLQAQTACSSPDGITWPAQYRVHGWQRRDIFQEVESMSDSPEFQGKNTSWNC